MSKEKSYKCSNMKDLYPGTRIICHSTIGTSKNVPLCIECRRRMSIYAMAKLDRCPRQLPGAINTLHPMCGKPVSYGSYFCEEHQMAIVSPSKSTT